MRRLWHEASRRLRGHRRTAAMIAAARLTVCLLLLLCGSLMQTRLLRGADFTGEPNLWDVFLPCCLLASVLAATPLRVQTAAMIGSDAGILDENDIGFLERSSRLWLWLRALHIRLLGGFSLILSAMPALVLLIAALAADPAGAGGAASAADGSASADACGGIGLAAAAGICGIYRAPVLLSEDAAYCGGEGYAAELPRDAPADLRNRDDAAAGAAVGAAAGNGCICAPDAADRRAAARKPGLAAHTAAAFRQIRRAGAARCAIMQQRYYIEYRRNAVCK